MVVSSPKVRALRSRLPDDLATLVMQHWAASVLQTAWLRYVHFAHARSPVWPEVRRRLSHLWPVLITFPKVRREWRREPESWMLADDLASVAHEARESFLWGVPSSRLSDS